MLRIPSTLLAAMLALAGFAATPAYAADPHWFYDNYNADQNNAGQNNGGYNNGYNGRYEDNNYNNGRYGERRHIPELDYSVYQPPRLDDGGNGYRNRGYDSRFFCLQGVESLKATGFRYIEVVDCTNGSCVYEAVRGREPWRIEVSRASGRIVNVDPLGN